MLQPKLTNCSECNDIQILLNKIDCKLAKLGHVLYGNVVFLLTNSISAVVMYDLLNYKRILTYKQVSPDYCEDYTVEMISSVVRRLTAGEVCTSCNDDVTIITTTSTTTTIPHTTTTTTTITTISPN